MNLFLWEIRHCSAITLLEHLLNTVYMIFEAPGIQSVSQLTASIRHLLEGTYRFVHVRGEISNCRTPFSGHVYFVLKDGSSQIRCVLFKSQKRYLDVPIEDGQEIICHGRVSVYEQRGEYQIIVDTVDQAGAGILQEQFERLKLKLKEEGLFDERRKKNIPLFPKHVVVITSATGAALQDFLKIYNHISPPCKISIYPVAVQGKGAAKEISSAVVKVLENIPADLIVLCRGGGSLEDLWAFNDENLARVIADSQIPTVTGIGHEIDFTIADFCADLRCPTPTAAASQIFSNYSNVRQRLNFLEQKITREMRNNLLLFSSRLHYASKKLHLVEKTVQNNLLKTDYTISRFVSAFQSRLNSLQQQADTCSYRLRQYSPQNQLLLAAKTVENLQARLQRAAINNFEKKEAEFTSKAALLDSVSPLATLSRGYSITRLKKGSHGGKLITRSSQVNLDDTVEVTLCKGKVECSIDKIID